MALCREAAMSAVNRVLLELRGQPQNQIQSSADDPLESRVQPEPAASDGEAGDLQTAPASRVGQEESGQDPMQVPYV